MAYQLADGVAIVTGGSRGIGKTVALGLAARGAKVVIADILDGRQTVAEIEGAGGEGLFIQTDIAQDEEVKALIDAVLAQFGRIDILVNCAAVCPTTHPEEISQEEWDRVLDVNLTGTFLCCRAVLPAMRRQGGGRIINLASVAGKAGGLVSGFHYTAAKAGVIALGKCFAKLAAPYGITVNTVCPGPTETDMTAHWDEEQVARLTKNIPLNRFGRPAEIASGVLYLASEEAGWITGETLDINGGMLMD
ncbi:MAG: SDR family NAD(P)-dependent oxidoreductase [Limnochordia bacterium]